MADPSNEIDLDSIIDRLLEGVCRPKLEPSSSGWGKGHGQVTD